MQRDFIQVINKMLALYIHAIAITAEDFPDIRDAIRPGVAKAIQVKAYYPAFQYLLKWLAGVLDERGFPSSERIAFVFDQQKEYEGNAKALYDHVQTEDERFAYGRRLGRSLLHRDSIESNCKLPMLSPTRECDLSAKLRFVVPKKDAGSMNCSPASDRQAK